MPKNKTNKLTKKVVSQRFAASPISFKSIRTLVIIAIVIAIGVIILALTRAEDLTQVTVQIPKNSFTYPSNAIFVSTLNGNDANSSATKDYPLKTLKAAISKAKAAGSGTIVARGGVYREALGSINFPLTVQSYQGEEVWLDGSDPVTDWVQSGTTWVKQNWTAGNTICPSSLCFDSAIKSSETANSELPDMTFYDDKELTQVKDLISVTAGTFFVDRDTNKLYIGSNPSGHKVEASTKKIAVQYYQSTSSGSKLLGIGVRRFASNVSFSSVPAMIEVSNGAKNIEFDSVLATQSSSNGLFIGGNSDTDRASGITIKNSVFAQNGGSGIAGRWLDQSTLTNNNIYANNTQKLQYDNANGSYAGIKFSRSNNLTVKNNLFQDNYGTGFWCDLYCNGVKITGNMARGNKTNGIFYEVSYNGIIASNVSYNNGQYGFKLSSQGLKVYNNTAYNNSNDNYFLYDDPTRITSTAVEAVNNISAGGPNSKSGNRLMYDWFFRSSISSVVLSQDYNYYFRSNSLPTYVLGWVGTGVNYQYPTYNTTLTSQTAKETNTIAVENQAIGTLFVDASNGNFKLVAASSAVNSGKPLPPDVAAALGLTPDVKVNRGALSWKNGSSSALTNSTPAVPTAQPNIYAQYFSNPTLSGSPAIAGYDAQINNLWQYGSPNSYIPVDNFSVRWNGKVNVPISGSYQFSTVSDDGVRVWLNGNLVIDNWTYHATTTNYSNYISLNAGMNDIKVEYFEAGGISTMQLRWTGPTGTNLSNTPITSSYFYH